MTLDESTLGRLVRIETKVDSILDVGLDHEARIRRIERYKAALPLTVIVAAGGVVASLVI